MQVKKVVLLHDWLTGQRGGEHVLEALCELFPQAPLYTLIHKKGSVSPLIENRQIHTSFLDKIPGIHEGYRKFLPLFPTAADSLHIKEGADLVLSSSHCVIKAVKKPIGAKHASYIHSPMRYIYDQFDAYFGKQAPLMQQLGARVFRGYLTDYDLKSNQNVDLMIANSRFVQGRISKFYNRESVVVNPFVDLEYFGKWKDSRVKKENYFVMVTAFAPNKRVDLAVQAFNNLGLKLKIVGGGQQETALKKMAGPEIEFMGSLSREALSELVAKAQAFIFPGVEDFGITPLESMAAGTPVIAFRAGGVLETLTDKTAVFFDEPTVESLVAAVNKFKPENFKYSDLYAQASKFSRDRFKKEIMKVLSENLNFS